MSVCGFHSCPIDYPGHSVKSKTHRWDGSLITFGTPRVGLAVCRPGGQIHKATRVLIRWNMPPYPEMDWHVACGVRKFSRYWPVPLSALNNYNACRKCFGACRPRR